MTKVIIHYIENIRTVFDGFDDLGNYLGIKPASAWFMFNMFEKPYFVKSMKWEDGKIAVEWVKTEYNSVEQFFQRTGISTYMVKQWAKGKREKPPYIEDIQLIDYDYTI